VGCNCLDAEPDKIATTEFAINRKVE